MFNSLCRASVWVFLILSLPILSGCGSGAGSAVATGTVTYEGKPLAAGTVSFFPVDGHGATNGGPIKDGKYTVTELVPGQKRVEISGRLEAAPVAAPESEPFNPRKSKEAAKKAEEEFQKKNASGNIDPITAADGNKKVVAVTAGTQTINFELKKPAN